MERREDSGSRGMPRSCSYAVGDTAETVCVKFHGISERQEELKYKYRSREFWCKGYYVDTAGKNTSRIAEYIKNQLKEDQLGEQLTMSEVGPFTGSR